jgi:hypothetical protein
LERLRIMAAKARITEEVLLAEAMECTTDRLLQTIPLAEEEAFALWPS